MSLTFVLIFLYIPVAHMVEIIQEENPIVEKLKICTVVAVFAPLGKTLLQFGLSSSKKTFFVQQFERFFKISIGFFNILKLSIGFFFIKIMN